MDITYNEMSTLKIYFRYGQQASGQSFWKRLWNNNLGQLLLKKAREMNIGQAAIFTAKSGYLSGGMIISNLSEIPSTRNPVYLELIDSHEKVMEYITHNKPLLDCTNVILINDNSYQLVQLKDH